jgi:hypothetical protein
VKKFTYIVFVFALIATSFKGIAQVYPVNVSTTMTPPNPVKLSDFYSASNSSFKSTIVLNDPTKPSINTRLKIRIESNNIKIETKSNFMPTSPLVLTSGVPSLLMSSDFASYLSSQNVTISGANPSSFYSNGGKLPEGFYQICVTVLDYNTGIPISQPSCAMVNIFQEQPPRLLKPECEKMFTPLTPQSVFFSWQASPGGSPTLAATSQYKLSVWKVIDNNSDGFAAVQNGQSTPVYTSSSLTQSAINMDLTTTQLDVGFRYAYQVQASDQQGRNVYANDGKSEFCWFYYGYPEGGKIVLNQPKEGGSFKKNDDKIFQWTAPDKKVQGQNFSYTIKIVKINKNQTKEDALKNNSVWNTQTLSATSSTKGATYELPKPLDSDQHYAWKVSARTGTQDVASSEIGTFYGPPFIEEFNAGNFKVLVKRTETKDLKNLKGTGLVMLSALPGDTVSCEFDSIAVKELSNQYFMESGEVFFDLSQRDPMVLTPIEKQNGNAKFVFKKGKLSKRGLYYGGIVTYLLPHPLVADSIGAIAADMNYYQVDRNYKISGTATISKEQTFELADPYKHALRIFKGSDIVIGVNEYKLRLKGEFLLPAAIKTNNKKRYSLEFSEAKDLFTIKVPYLLSNAKSHFTPIDNSGFAFKPMEAVIDLNENSSPGIKENDKGWKGVYFPKFKAEFESKSNKNQIFLPIKLDEEIVQEGDTVFYTTSEGLFLRWDFNSSQKDLTFNTFPSTLVGTVIIEKNNLINSKLSGELMIPFLSQTEVFTYRIPLSIEGLKKGYLDQKLKDRNLSFNPYGAANRIELKLNRAVFKSNEYLKVNLDLEHIGIDTKFSGLDDFRIYGDGFIGFGKKNGKVALRNSVSGAYKGFKVLVDEIMASYDAGFYHIALLSTVDFGTYVLGDKGAPKVVLSSVMALDSKLKSSSQANSVEAPVPYKAGMEKAKKVTARSFIKIKNQMSEFSGWIDLINDDPNLGTVFSGEIDGKLLLPVKVPMKANLIVGDNNGTIYWYFDSYFQDEKGVGIPIISPFNCVGFEGRMYHHMSLKNGDIVFDAKTDLAQTSFMQVIDGKTSGAMFQGDWVADLSMSSTKTTMSVTGDISCLNSNKRESVGGAIAGKVGASLLEAAAAFISIDIKIPLLDNDELGIKVDKTGNKFSYENKGTSIYAGLEQKTKNGIPGARINLTKGNYSLVGDGYSNGVYAMKLSDKSNYLEFGSKVKNSAFVNGKIKGIDLTSTYVYDKKLLEGEFTSNSKTLAFSANAKSKILRGDFTYETGKTIYGMYKNKKVYAGFTFDKLKYDLEADPGSKIVDMTMDVSGSLVGATYWANDNKGQVTFKNSSYDFIGNSTTKLVGDAVLKNGDKELKATFNKPLKSGTVDYKHTATQKFHGELKNANYAYLEMDVNGNKFGIGGNSAADSGRVLFENSDVKLHIQAKPKEKTGNLNFDYQGDYIVKSMVHPDSSFASFKGKGYAVAVSGYGKGFGRLQLAKGDYKADVIGNQLQKYGSIYLTDGSTTLSAAGCKSGMSKAAAAEYDGIQGEFGSFSYTDANYDFGGYLVPKDTVRGALFVNGSGVSAAGNKDSKYDIRLKDPGSQLDISGKLKDRKLSLDFDGTSQEFDATADFSAETGFFELREGSKKYRFDATSSNSNLLVKETGFTAAAVRSSSSYELKHVNGSNTLKMISGLTDLKTSMELKTSAITVEMDEDGDLKITEGSDVMEIEETTLSGLQISKNGKTQTSSSTSLKTSKGKIKASIVGNSKKLTYKGTEEISITSNGGLVEFTATIDGKTWKSSNSATKVEMLCGVASYTIENKVVTISTASNKSIEINADGGQINYAAIASELNLDDRLDFEETNVKYVAWMDETKGVAIQKQDKKVIIDLSDKILLQYDPNKYLKIENATLDLKVEKVTLFIDPTKKLVYDDTKNHFEIGPQKFELLQGLTGVSIDGPDFKLSMDADNYLKLGIASLDFKVKGYAAGFNAQNPLSFVKGDFKFNLGVSGLKMDLEGISLGLKDINGVPTLNLTNPIGGVDLSAEGFGMNMSNDMKFSVNTKNYIEFRALDKLASFSVGKMQFLDSIQGISFELGGDYLAAVKLKSYAINIPKAGGLSFDLPSTKIDLDINSSLEMAIDLDGFKLDVFKGGFPFKADLGPIDFELPNIPNGFKADINLDGFNAGLTSIEGVSTSFDIGTASIGTIKFGRDRDANVVVGYKTSGCEFELKAGDDGISASKKGNSCARHKLPNLFLPALGAPPKTSGAGKIPASSKPQYLKGKIADEAGGLSRGEINLSIDTKAKKITGTAGWNSTSIICAKGKMGFESDGNKGTWKLSVGTAASPITIKPGCVNDFSGKGYFLIKNNGASFFVKKSVSYTLKTQIGDDAIGAKLTTKFKSDLGFGGGVALDPLALKELTLKLNTSGSVTASYWIVAGGDKTKISLASISLSGNVKMKPPSSGEVKLKGELKGSITIADIITESFKFKIDKTYD